MERLPRRLWKLFLRAGWAPLSVLILHQVILYKGWRENTDFLMHFSGGLSFAYFAYYAIEEFGGYIGTLNRFGHFLIAFLSTCTMALLWEIAEFASDGITGGNIQHSISETMWDLVNGTLGGATTLTLVFLASKKGADR